MLTPNVTHSRKCLVRFVIAFVLLLTLLTLNPTLHAAPAYTDIGGPITSDTVWILANSPYIVTSNVQVMSGVTLTIQAGVMVKFNTGRLLQVDGTLIARGTTASPITFTSNQPVPQPGDWANIYFSDSSVDAVFDAGGNYQGGSVLQYCVVEWGGGNVQSVIHAPYAAPFVDHCTVRNNASRGIRIGDSSEYPDTARSIISSNTISGNSGGGIYAVNSLVVSNTLTGNSLSGNTYGGGIYAEYSTVRYNTATGNSAYYGGGIYATNDTAVNNNIVSYNSAYRAGGIDVSGNSTACTNTITYNSATGHAGGIRAEFYTTVCNNWIAHNSADSYAGGVYGTWCTIRDNIVTDNSSANGGGIYVDYGDVKNNVVSQNAATGADGSGGGIYDSHGSGMFLNRVMSNTIVNNSATKQGSGVYSVASVFNNTIIGNATISPTAISGGLAVDGAETHDNNLYGNSNYDAVAISAYYDVSGTHNYWGTVVDVDISSHIYDHSDNATYHAFQYVPYLQDLSPLAPVPPPLNLRADFANGSATLDWDAIPSAASFRYRVYYDTDTSGPPYAGTGATQGNSPIDVGNATHYTLSGLGNSIYYIAVTASDQQRRESWYSNQVNSLRRVYLPVVLKN